MTTIAGMAFFLIYCDCKFEAGKNDLEISKLFKYQCQVFLPVWSIVGSPVA